MTEKKAVKLDFMSSKIKVILWVKVPNISGEVEKIAHSDTDDVVSQLFCCFACYLFPNTT